MESMTLGSLSFICGPSSSSAFGITLNPQIQGLDAAEYRIVNYPIPGQDGGRVSQAYYDSRPITLQGIISGQSASEYLFYRSQLSQACAINRDSYGYPSLTKLAFTTLDGTSYFTYVQPQKPVFDFGAPTWSPYIVSLLAPDYRIYGATQITTGHISRQVSGGIIVPTIVPVLGGGTSGGSAYISNGGTTETHPIITFTGPLTNPYVLNQTTGYAFQLDYTLLGGDQIVVDMYEHSVVFNGSSDFIAYVDSLSSWWTLAPGGNNIVMSTSSSADTGYVEVTGYPAYAGV